MKELIQKIAADEALQEQIRACEDAKAFAVLLNIDEAQADQIFAKVKAILESDEIPDELLDQASGGRLPCHTCDPNRDPTC